jgi:hypothetical protein
MKKIRIKITGVNRDEDVVETVEGYMELVLPEGTQFVNVGIHSDITWEDYELPGEEE